MRDAGATVAPADPSTAHLVGLGISFAVLLAAVMAWALIADPPAWDLTLHRAGMDQRTPGLTTVAIALSVSSEYIAYVVAAVGTALALRPRPWWFGAVAGILLLAFAQGVRVALAAAAARSRPPEADWAFHAAGYSLPSGHTATATVAAGLLCLGLARWLRSAWLYVAMVVLAVWAVAEGVGRVYLGVHWPTDVVAGWLLGGLLTVLAAGLFARLRTTPSRRQSCLRRSRGTCRGSVAAQGSSVLGGVAPLLTRPRFGRRRDTSVAFRDESVPRHREFTGVGGTSRPGDGQLRGARFRSAPAARPGPASGLVKGQRGHRTGHDCRGLLGPSPSRRRRLGAVYLARHPTLPRDVALKVLHPGLATTPGCGAASDARPSCSAGCPTRTSSMSWTGASRLTALDDDAVRLRSATSPSC